MAFSEYMNFNNSIELNIFLKAEISTYILEEKTSYKLFLLVYALITAHLAIVIMNYRYASYKYHQNLLFVFAFSYAQIMSFGQPIECWNRRRILKCLFFFWIEKNNKLLSGFCNDI